MIKTGDDVTGSMNLGNPTELSVRELAKVILDLTGLAFKNCASAFT